MGMTDIGTWILAGLITGGLAGALNPGITPTARRAVLGAGVVGALLGGWIAGALFTEAAVAFLGASCIGVLGAVGGNLLVRRHGPTRYHT